MSTLSTTSAGNLEAITAWDTVLFAKITKFRRVLMAVSAAHGDRALERLGVARGARVIDLGCGFGETTRELARRVGPSGRVVGVDAAHSVLEVARAEATEPIDYVEADIEAAIPEGPYDAAYARFGLMFFARPVIALRHVREQLVPGGRLCATVWRRREDNECMHVAELIARDLLGQPDKGDAVTCGPGPFSMANADVLTDQLLAAGFTHVELVRSDADVCVGASLDEAVELALELGPAGEIVRLAGATAKSRDAELRAALRDGLRPYLRAGGVWAHSSTWIVDARR
jgi:trans-aconitate methyltransferase